MAAPARRLPAPDVPCRLPGPPSVQGMVERQRSEGAVEGEALLEHDSYLPMEMLCKVFEHLDARTLMVVIPAVCRWWREVYYSFATSLDFSWVGYQEVRPVPCGDLHLIDCPPLLPPPPHHPLGAMDSAPRPHHPAHPAPCLLTADPGVLRSPAFCGTGECAPHHGHGGSLAAVAAKHRILPSLRFRVEPARQQLWHLFPSAVPFPAASHTACRDPQDDVLLGMAVKYALGAVVDVNLSGCEFLTEESVVILAQHCTNLRSVDLRRTSMGDTALAALGEFCNKLRVVILDDCLQVTDEGLSSLADGCPNLREVSLRGMHREVRDAGIANLAVSCGQLRKLNLSSCAMLTDATLEAIAENCKFLEELSLAYTNVSSTGLLRLSGECDGLQTLDVSHCRRVTTDAVGALRAACPSLDHVRCVGSAVDDVWADFEEDVGF